MEAMAAALLSDDSRKFWEETSRIKGRSSDYSAKVDDARTSEAISSLFKHKYDAIFNSVASTDDELQTVRQRIRDNMESCQRIVVSDEVMARALERLKAGKSGGPEGSNF